MAIYTELGHGIEGNQLSGLARKVEFKQGSLRRHPITNTLMVTYELDRNCELSITSICTLSEKEKELRRQHFIHLELDDSIKANASRLCIEAKRNCLSVQIKEGISGRHGASVFSTPSRAIAVIKTPLSIYGNKFIQAQSSQKEIQG